MSRGTRVAILFVVAVAVFGGALLASRGGGGSGSDQVVSGGQSSGTAPKTTAPPGVSADGCPTNAAADPAYKIAVGPVRPDSKEVTLDVTRDGAPVTRATVCIEAAMSGMAHGGLREKAKELPGGGYQFGLAGGMQGNWSGTASIAEPGRPAAAVPLAFDVP